MIQHHHWSLAELEDMLPYEKQIYQDLLLQWVKEENERVQQEQQQRQKDMITFKRLLEKLFKEATVKAPAGKESNRAKDKVGGAMKKLTAKKFAGTKIMKTRAVSADIGVKG